MVTSPRNCQANFKKTQTHIYLYRCVLIKEKTHIFSCMCLRTLERRAQTLSLYPGLHYLSLVDACVRRSPVVA